MLTLALQINQAIVYRVNHQLFVYTTTFHGKPPIYENACQLFVYPSFVYNLFSRSLQNLGILLTDACILAPVKNFSNISYNYVWPTTWYWTIMDSPKIFLAFLAFTIRRTRSAQPAYFRFGSKASWADLVRLIVKAKKAKKFFGESIMVMDHMVRQT